MLAQLLHESRSGCGPSSNCANASMRSAASFTMRASLRSSSRRGMTKGTGTQPWRGFDPVFWLCREPSQNRPGTTVSEITRNGSFGNLRKGDLAALPKPLWVCINPPASGPRGGVVTQRSAKPCTPVQFWSWPPLISSMACSQPMRSRISSRRTNLQETESAATAPGCHWPRAVAAECGARAEPQDPPEQWARSPFARRPAADQIRLRSSRSPRFESAMVAKLSSVRIERFVRIL